MKTFTSLLALLALISLVPPVQAGTTMQDLEGEWVLSNLTLPLQSDEDPFDARRRIPLQGLPDDAEIGAWEATIGYGIMRLWLEGDGFFSGYTQESTLDEEFEEVFGEMRVNSDGFLVIDGYEEFQAAINASRSLLVTITRDYWTGHRGEIRGSLDIDLVTRVPETLTVADLEGVWMLSDNIFEALFNRIYYDPVFPLTIGSDGVAHIVDDDGEFEVSFVTGTDGTVTANLPDGESVSFLINSSKDVMVRTALEYREDFESVLEYLPGHWGSVEDEEEYLLNIAVRKPETLTASDLVGVWNLYILAADEKWYAENPWGGSGENDGFQPYGMYKRADVEKYRLRIRAPKTEGALSAPLEATVVEPMLSHPEARGARVLGEVRIVDGQPVATVNIDGRAETMPFFINASKDFMFAYESEPPPSVDGLRRHDLLLAVKKYEGDLGLLEQTPGAAPRSWLRIPWFGNVFLMSPSGGWAFHDEHGWVFLSGRNLADGFWVFFPGLRPAGSPQGIPLWTSERLYPNFLRENPDRLDGPLAGFSFVNYARDYYKETGEIWFYDFAESSWIESIPFVGIDK